MRKQLVVTIESHTNEIDSLTVLREVSHSPEWIGDLDNWEIQSFTINETYSKFTVLLENSQWEEPKIQGLKTGELFKALREGCSRNEVQFAKFKGADSKLVIVESHKGLIAEIKEFQNANHLILCMCGEKDCTMSLDLNGVYTAISVENFENRGLTKEEVNSLPLAIKVSETEIFTVIKYLLQDDKLLIIYNQDLKLTSNR